MRELTLSPDNRAPEYTVLSSRFLKCILVFFFIELQFASSDHLECSIQWHGTLLCKHIFCLVPKYYRPQNIILYPLSSHFPFSSSSSLWKMLIHCLYNLYVLNVSYKGNSTMIPLLSLRVWSSHTRYHQSVLPSFYDGIYFIVCFYHNFLFIHVLMNIWIVSISIRVLQRNRTDRVCTYTERDLF